MRKRTITAAMMLCALPAFAADEAQIRILSCKGPDASMEVYVPESAATGTGIGGLTLTTNVYGFYALDLTGAGKGKHLEPVRVRLSGDGKFLIVDQYVRGLPQTRVPVRGGSVDFDDRFGTNAVCGPVNPE